MILNSKASMVVQWLTLLPYNKKLMGLNPCWRLSVSSFRILPMFVLVISRYSSFPKEMQGSA